MKKLIIIFTGLAVSICLIAQEKNKQREVGLIFHDLTLQSVGLSYKTGTDQSLWRFQSIYFGSNYQQSDSKRSLTNDATNSNINIENERENINININMKAGKEFRRPLNDDFEFRYGADLSFGFSYSCADRTSTSENNEDSNESSSASKSFRYSPGVNLVLGFNYLVNDNIIIGAELMPAVGYHIYTNNDEGDHSESESNDASLNFSANTSSVLLSLAYRF